MENPVIIIGTASFAQLGLEILQQNHILVYGFLAEKNLPELSEINHIPILATIEEDAPYLEKAGKNYSIFVALEQLTARQQYIKKLYQAKNKVVFINLIHPLANLATSAQIGIGNLIDAGTSLGPTTNLGNHCFLQKQIVIESGATIQDFVQIGSGSVIGEEVFIEENAFIGPGATLIAGIHIGKGARVGAGSVVLESIKANEIVLGNPAKPFKIN